MSATNLTVTSLTKFYGAQPALHGVSFALNTGSTALLGPNGSGKSTLLRLLATLISPDAGEIRFCAQNYAADVRSVRAHIGFMPQEVDLPHHLTPYQILRYLAQVRCIPMQHDMTIHETLAALGISHLSRTPLAKLSGGQVRLVAAAQALLGKPRLLLLDEPTRGLAPDERNQLWHAVVRFAPEIMLFSSHNADEAEDRAERLLIFRGGRIRFEGLSETLKARAADHVYEVRVPKAVAAVLQREYHVSQIRDDGALRTLRMVGTPPDGVESKHVSPTIEDAYLWLMRSP
ncbi:MAG: ABC transporter ATP-binding protein [Anaerolinea sp.]|nr:ABC transporter ATP-binding protein [Anaerolinea sp.]